MIAPLLVSAALAGTRCPAPSIALPAHEPQRTAGPSALVTGLYVQGGALIPGCHPAPRGPYAGTLTVRSATGGRLVARVTLRRAGRLFRIRLPAGRYVVSATQTGGGLRAVPRTVTIAPHVTVRQDLFVDVP